MSSPTRWMHAMVWAACLGFVCACATPTRPTPRPQAISAPDLLLNKQDLPEGWYSRPGILDDDRHYPLAEAAVVASFDAVRQVGVATHIILQYRDGQLAAGQFALESSAHFNSPSGTAPWEKPGALQYKSTVADQFDCGCKTEARHDGSGEVATICVAISRYDEFISVLSTWIVPERMSYSDLERVLGVIDTRAAQRLGKPTAQ